MQNREHSDRVAVNAFTRQSTALAIFVQCMGRAFVDAAATFVVEWVCCQLSLFHATRSLRSRFCICRPTESQSNKRLQLTGISMSPIDSSPLSAVVSRPLKAGVMPHPMTSISPQLIRLPAKISGEWGRRWNRNVWDGTVSCPEPFVILLLIRFESQLFWAKSLPSKDNLLDLRLDMFPVSKIKPHFQFLFSCGSGAFIQGVMAELADREYMPLIQTPEIFDTGVVLPLARVDCAELLDLSFVCIAKADVAVRRRRVWGLKSHLVGDLESPSDEIFPRGRNGAASLAAAA